MSDTFKRIQKAVMGLNEISNNEDNEYGEATCSLATVLWRNDYLGVDETVLLALLDLAESHIKEYEHYE